MPASVDHRPYDQAVLRLRSSHAIDDADLSGGRLQLGDAAGFRVRLADSPACRFLDGLYDGQIGLAATLRAAKGLAAVVDILKAADAQRGIAAAYVAADPHRAECLAQRAEGVGLVWPRSGHDRR